MNIRKLHYISGIVIAAFVGLHLINHSCSIAGAAKHIEVMTHLRFLYRNFIVETVIILAVGTQIHTGLKLFRAKRQVARSFFEKLHIYSGLCLAIFFIIHLSAVFSGRYILNLDTNFYFGVAGLNLFPFNLFFIPYYFLAIASFFGHIAAIHNHRKKKAIFGLSAYHQSIFILTVGIGVALFLIFGLTNKFQGFQIPDTYNIFSSK